MGNDTLNAYIIAMFFLTHLINLLNPCYDGKLHFKEIDFLKGKGSELYCIFNNYYCYS